jgi:radical SAM protein with 4Fe4S-binding SPASM domain
MNFQTLVGHPHCLNIEKLVAIRPDGLANSCTDFVDYSLGNKKTACIETLWNGEKSEHFRLYRREHPLVTCYGCGAKYMSQRWSDYG